MKIHKFKETKNIVRGHNGILYEILPKGSVFKYRLLKNYFVDTGIKTGKKIEYGFIKLMTTGRLHIKAGYEWDGATGFPDIEQIMRATVEHDSLYTLIILQLIPFKYKPVADLLFKNTCLADKMKPCIVKIVYWVLYVFGWQHIINCIKKQNSTMTQDEVLGTGKNS